jgi:hypothetical protein
VSVLRQQNWLQQQRVDIPHVRALESSICADFDLLAGSIFGGSRALVVSGFDMVPAVVGTAATSLQLHTANGVLIHGQASESGSIFNVPSTRAVETLNAANARVTGSFAASSVNYVGVDLRRTADSTTTDLVQFLDANTLTEKPKSVPLARTLDYIIIISTQDFSANTNIAPLAKVTTDAAGNITALEDARNLAFRLGSGGTITNAKATYSWPNTRKEVGDNTDFNVGDKTITSLKSWMDATMTRLWEIGGGEFWYSPTADRNVQMIRGYAGATVFTGGEYFEWSGTHLHWKGLAFIFDNSTGNINQVADQTSDSSGLTNLADGECIYVDLNRTANRTGGSSLVAAKAALATLGTPTVPGSRQVIAWRSGSNIFTRNQYFAVGTAFAVATPSALGVVKLTAAAGAPGAPVVPSIDASGYAQMQGISRGAIGAGTLSIGREANDNSIAIGSASLNAVGPLSSGLVELRGTSPNGGSGQALLHIQDDRSGDGMGFYVWGFYGNQDPAKQNLTRYNLDTKGRLTVEQTHAHGFVARGPGFVEGNTATGANGTANISGGYSAVMRTGAGTGTCAPSGTIFDGSFVVRIVTGGGLGTAQFTISDDGGQTFSGAPINIPGGGVVNNPAGLFSTFTGLTLTFAGTFTQFDTYRFVSTRRPVFVRRYTNSGGEPVNNDSIPVIGHAMDNMGRWTGSVSTYEQNWMLQPVAIVANGYFTNSAEVYALMSGANSAAQVNVGNTTWMKCLAMKHDRGTTNGGYCFTSTTQPLVCWHDNQVVTIVFEFSTDDDHSAGAGTCEIWMGLTTANATAGVNKPNSSNDYILLKSLAADTTIKLATKRATNAGADVDSGVTLSPNTNYRVKIELYPIGVGLNGNSIPCFVYINEKQVMAGGFAGSGGSEPAAGINFYLTFGIQGVSGVASKSLWVSPYKIQYERLAAKVTVV